MCDRCNGTDEIEEYKIVEKNGEKTIKTKLIDREITLCSKCYREINWER